MESNENVEVTEKKKLSSFTKQIIAGSIYAIIVGVAFGLLRYFLFYNGKGFSALQIWADIISVTGVIGVFSWLLLLVASYGTFDMIAYGCKKFWYSLTKKDAKGNLPRTFKEYVDAKYLKRQSKYYYFLIPQITVLIAGIILLIIYYSTKGV